MPIDCNDTCLEISAQRDREEARRAEVVEHGEISFTICSIVGSLEMVVCAKTDLLQTDTDKKSTNSDFIFFCLVMVDLFCN